MGNPRKAFEEALAKAADAKPRTLKLETRSRSGRPTIKEVKLTKRNSKEIEGQFWAFI